MKPAASAWMALCVVAALSAGTVAAQGAPAERLERVNRLEAEVIAAEDLRAIKKLQRTYGYYLDKGMWTDLAEYFTDDAVANYPAGVYVGKASIREHLYRNVGNVPMGQVGLGDNRLYNHMNIQPVVHLDAGGRTAKGRWRAFAYFGSLGGGATWAEGVYEMTYAKDNGVWKIATLDYTSGFGAPYQTGWAAPATPAATPGAAAEPARPRRQLPHPADRERKKECEGFATACVPPFHYANPGTAAGAQAWISGAGVVAAPAGGGSLDGRVAQLAQRAILLRDEQDIENLQRVYGYYFDAAQWDQVADLFATNGTIEMGLQGVFAGKRRVREYLGSLGPNGKTGGLSDGVLNDHVQLQIVVDVAADGRSARARARAFAMTGVYQQGGQWSEGTYENSYVKQDGVWKFQSLHYYPTFITDYDKGWGKDAQPVPAVNAQLPPDRPPTEIYAIYPKAFVPPYHYVNPVTGLAPVYPAVGAPAKPLAAAQLSPAAPRVTAPPRITNVDAAIAQAEAAVARVKDMHELENLESAYGYYLDKNLWNNLADLFARDGSMELAQRGVYKSQARVRAFLFAVFGRGQEGPIAGRLGNHVQMQPVIHVADDGLSAKMRVRMMQQLSMGPRASMGGAIYENEAVKEDGIWKFSKVHAFNTFTAAYEGGWARAPGRGVPGPSKELPPDGPPTFVFEMFPNVYDIPYHYANPVTGRTQLPPVRKVVFAQPAPVPPPAAPALPSTPADIAAVMREIGPRIETQRTSAIYAALQPKEPYQGIALSRDVAYGPHARNVLDIFTAEGEGAAKRKPVVVFIHGGGFSRGAKHSPGSPFYDNIGVWAASKGLVGVTINYRLAPEFPYPAGVEDLTRVVSWLKAHAAEYGGDPDRIFLWGHSAGGAHAADYIVRTKRPGIRGAILTSGIYALGDKPSIWKDYYGEDPARYRERESYAGLLRTKVPLLVTYAELDPENFVTDTEGLIKGREQAGKPVQHLRIAGHSHVSETYAVGTSDESLSAPVLAFIQATSAKR